MKFSNFSKLVLIVVLMISFFSSKTLANYEKVFFDFSVELVNGKSIDCNAKIQKDKQYKIALMAFQYNNKVQLL